MVKHEDFLKGLEEEEYIEPKWKRPVIMILGIVMIMLILGYYLIVSDALLGLINSNTLKDNVLEKNGITVTFRNNTLEQLQEEYIAHQGREIKACLFGEVENTKYAVTGISFPEVISANVVHILTPGCPNDAIIDIHSHPINRCIPSGVDLRNFGIRKRTSPELIMMIMCWKNRFSVTV